MGISKRRAKIMAELKVKEKRVRENGKTIMELLEKHVVDDRNLAASQGDAARPWTPSVLYIRRSFWTGGSNMVDVYVAEDFDLDQALKIIQDIDFAVKHRQASVRRNDATSVNPFSSSMSAATRKSSLSFVGELFANARCNAFCRPSNSDSH